MRLSINLFMTFDGVSQSPGAPDEDRRNGFNNGGWLMPFFDEGCGQAVHGWFERCGALLLGRHTYETFASHWPQVTDPTDLAADRINNGRKYVVASQPLPDAWTDTTTVLGSNFLDEIARLKSEDSDLELQVHGSVHLAQTLHEAGLIDIYRFLIAPTVVGSGAGIFSDEGPARSLHVEASSTTGSGVHVVEMTPEDAGPALRTAVHDGQDTIVEA